MGSANGDAIHIEQLEVSARIGVTEVERERLQRLSVSITIWPKEQFGDLRDDIACTIDYSAVCTAARDFVVARSDRLIETLAASLADHLVAIFPARHVRIEVRKFVLPDAQYAAVVVMRSASVD